MDTIAILQMHSMLMLLSLSFFLSLPLRRVLNKKLLSTVLMYLGPDSSAKTVCKYWKAVMKEAS